MRLQAPGGVDCHPFLVPREFVEKNLRHNEFDFSGPRRGPPARRSPAAADNLLRGPATRRCRRVVSVPYALSSVGGLLRVFQADPDTSIPVLTRIEEYIIL